MGGVGGFWSSGDRERKAVEDRANLQAQADEKARADEAERRRLAGDAEDSEARARAAAAAAASPSSATSILTGDSDPLGVKRKNLLGF